MKRKVKLFLSWVEILIALIFFIYPGVTLVRIIMDPQLKTSGQSHLVPGMFEAMAGRFKSWSDDYIETEYAGAVQQQNVAGTEWPMFGSVFFLVTADDLQKQGSIDARTGELREAVDNAAEIVVSPVTATWVRNMWGDTYLDNENVFYRMLLILGLSSYESITGDLRHHALMNQQRLTLAAELANSYRFLLDDYPGECYPNDVLWAVAAIQRAAILDGEHHETLVEGLMEAYDGPVKSELGLPGFMMNKITGMTMQEPRGCGNSGILIFSPELDATVSNRWYASYEEHFWKSGFWGSGFTEYPVDSDISVMDVDSGPVILEYGSVACSFGIGAARAHGRMDHVVPLTLEVFATSWPTPFGLMIPGLMGYSAVGSSCLGEVAILFSMTRPVAGDSITPHNEGIPLVVWLALVFYFGIGSLLIFLRSKSIFPKIFAKSE